MARPRKAQQAEVTNDDDLQEKAAAQEPTGYSIVESETSGYLVKHGKTPVHVAPSKQAAEAYVALLERK